MKSVTLNLIPAGWRWTFRKNYQARNFITFIGQICCKASTVIRRCCLLTLSENGDTIKRCPTKYNREPHVDKPFDCLAATASDTDRKPCLRYEYESRPAYRYVAVALLSES
eukprot:scaffold196853_cov27-Prasinocladus_malaysianus.AAC.1